MAKAIKLSDGGGVFAITATPIAVDLSALVGCEVAIFCDEQKIHFSGSPSATPATLVTTATEASRTALVADKLAAGSKAKRLVQAADPFLIVATATGSGTLFVKVISDVDFSQ